MAQKRTTYSGHRDRPADHAEGADSAQRAWPRVVACGLDTAGAAADQAAGGAGNADSDVVDAEFTEVKDKK